MFDSALELITEAASNSLFVFCFCNLIIVMILMGSKPTSNFEKESENPASPMPITNTCAGSKQEVSPTQSFQTSIDVKELSNSNPQQEQEAIVDEDCGEEDRNENGNSEEEEDDDDELKRRVEEFIEKVNRGWKEERLRTYHLVQAY